MTLTHLDVATTTLLAAPVRLTSAGPADPVRPVPAESWRAHLAWLGPLPVRDDLTEIVADSGLAGHGGAFVPVALKWRAAQQRRRPVTLVANLAESEPLAAKDGTVARQRPHLIVDGLLAAGRAVRAERLVVWLHGDDEGARDAIVEALHERPAEADLPLVEVESGPVHYLAGESTAIARALRGGPPLPEGRRDSAPSQTLVHNGETLARLAFLARGLANPPTRLLSIVTGSGRVVVEVDRSETFANLQRQGLLPHTDVLLLGGFAGEWAPWAAVAGHAVGEAEMRAVGRTLGAGVVVALPPGQCGVRHTADLLAYLASMSAGQCGPCLYGLPALAGSWERLARGRGGTAEVVRMRADLDAVDGRGACRHPDGAVRLARSALDAFAGDLAAHAARRPCRAPHTPIPGAKR